MASKKKQWWEEQKLGNPLMAKLDGTSFKFDYLSFPEGVESVELPGKLVDGEPVIVTMRKLKFNIPRARHYYWHIDDVRLA